MDLDLRGEHRSPPGMHSPMMLDDQIQRRSRVAGRPDEHPTEHSKVRTRRHDHRPFGNVNDDPERRATDLGGCEVDVEVIPSDRSRP